MRTPIPVSLTDEQRATLERWVRQPTTEQRLVLRARMILLLDQGKSNEAIGRQLGVRAATVSRWRSRFAKRGTDGLYDKPRSGPRPKYSSDTERRVLDLLDEPPPKGYAQWNGRLVANALGDVSVDQVWRILREQKIRLQRQRSWRVSTDEEFAAKAVDVVALYLNPPENALVLSVDAKPPIHALERDKGWLRLPNGRAFSAFSHEYTRHGSSTLFAALNVATGQVKTGHFKRRRRPDFLRFMNDVVADYPYHEIHVILHKLNTHKPKADRWLRRHKNVHFHFSPTRASWLNQIEIWFSILQRSAIRKKSFTSPRQLRDAIDDFIEIHSETAAPFEWTKVSAKTTPLKTGCAESRK